jgi:hypothetical protein
VFLSALISSFLFCGLILFRYGIIFFHIFLAFCLPFLPSFHLFPFFISPLSFSFLPLCLSLCVFYYFFGCAALFSSILLRFPNSLLRKVGSCLEWSVSVKFAVYTSHTSTVAYLRSQSFSASIFIQSSLHIEASYIGNRRWHLKSFKISTYIDNCIPQSDLHVNWDLNLTTRKHSIKWHWRHSKINI